MDTRRELGAPLDTFVIRFWHPRAVAAPWHGRVEHVQTGEGRAFRDLTDLMTFLEEYIGEKETKQGQP